jgi:hypothetical protein
VLKTFEKRKEEIGDSDRRGRRQLEVVNKGNQIWAVKTVSRKNEHESCQEYPVANL